MAVCAMDAPTFITELKEESEAELLAKKEWLSNNNSNTVTEAKNINRKDRPLRIDKDFDITIDNKKSSSTFLKWIKRIFK